MKKCVKCNSTNIGNEWRCLNCGFQPAIHDGFMLFSPNLAYQSDGFGKDDHDLLLQYEEKYFWFQTRNRLINQLITKYVVNSNSFMEVGCGNGVVLNSVINSGYFNHISGCEISLNGLVHSKNRIDKEVNLYQVDAREIPFINEFDAIGCFDILEHISADVAVLEQIHDALKLNASLVITVPQHMALWGPLDEYGFHVRRYERSELLHKLEQVGFKVQFVSSFISFLYPLMYIKRKFQPKAKTKKNFDIHSEFRINPILNLLFEIITNIEVYLITKGISFPFGGSLIVIARKVANSDSL